MKRKHLPVRIQSHGSCLPRIAAFLLTALLSCISTVTFAYDFSAVNDDGVTIYYNYINDNKEVEVTYGESYGSYSGAVNIPATVTNNKTTLNVTSIGEYAFRYGGNLTSVTIPNSVTSICEFAFSGCSKLTSVTIPSSVTSINRNTFSNCTSLTSITIPSSVTSIGESAFSYCSSLTSINIPNSVTSIGDTAFYLCSSLTSVTIPNSVTSIGEYAFKGCSKLTSVTIPSSVTSINRNTFAGCSSLTSITIHNSVTSIGESAFEGCSSLTSITIPSSVTSINRHTFEGCSSLTSITIHNSVTSIGESAFKGCSSLTSIDIPSSVTSINQYTFSGCSSLTSITIPNSVTSIDQYAFSRCSSLTSIDIPSSVTSIKRYTFMCCTSLTSITIPNSVTSIDQFAFGGCSSLASITIPSSVKSIGGGAFYECSRLASITIQTSITNSGIIIGGSAFGNCSSLTSINIPNSVISIGESAFEGCSNLTEVTLQGTTLPECKATAFDKISSEATLYCKAALADECCNTVPWNKFKIAAIPFTIEITDAGIATSCFDDDLDFSGLEVKAYIASGFNPETGKVLMTNVTEVPAGTGFIVKGTEGTYEIPAVATKYMYANMLVGTLKDTILQQTADTYTYYVLGKDTEGKAGFFLAKDDCKILANKAYLQISTSAVATTTSNVMSSLSIGFDDEDGTITGVAPVKTVEEEDMDGNTVIYRLNGDCPWQHRVKLSKDHHQTIEEVGYVPYSS